MAPDDNQTTPDTRTGTRPASASSRLNRPKGGYAGRAGTEYVVRGASGSMVGGYVFEVRTDAPDNGDVVVVRATGEVDMTVSPTFERSLLEAASTSEGRPVVVDLESLRFLDSSGVHALVRGYHAATAAGGSLTVRGATGVVARVLYITGVAEALGMSITGEPE